MDATLVLDSSGAAVHILPWQRALILVVLERAFLLEESDQPIYVPDQATRGHTVRRFEIRRPAIIQLYRYVGMLGSPALNRKNLRLRDHDRCQYCGEKLLTSEMTIDHVLPRSRGGRLTWENVVLACGPCNVRKGDRTPEEARMSLLQKPFRPKTSLVVERFVRQREGERRCG